ncbi:hypothetical protein Tco_0205037 [Tanacetum coccineum]
MLAPGNYVQWKSIINRYIDTKPNSELIHYCLQNLPYTYQWVEKIVPVAKGSSKTTIKRYMENYKNVLQDIRDQLNAEAESVQIILTGIDDDIYSTIDACPNACEMWKAVERLKQGESINVQDLETIFLGVGKITSRNRGKAIVTSSAPYLMILDNLATVTEDEVLLRLCRSLGIQCYNARIRHYQGNVKETEMSKGIATLSPRKDVIVFAKPEFLKKAQRVNPRLHDIGCCNDNFALMLDPESDETIRLDKESRSKLSDLIKLFDYDKLNNLYDFVRFTMGKALNIHYFQEKKNVKDESYIF